MLECVLSAYFAMVRIAAFSDEFLNRAHTLLERPRTSVLHAYWGRLCSRALDKLALSQGSRISEGVVAHERLGICREIPPVRLI